MSKEKVIIIALITLAIVIPLITLVLPPFARKSILLSSEVYYELPSGGYIYIDEEYIRYNENSFNGTLDYQITLNYNFVEGK